MSVNESTARQRTKVSPNLFQKGDRFYLITNVQGRQVFETLKARNKTDARTERDRRMSELRTSGLAAVGDRTLTVDALTAKFLEHERGPSSRLAPGTVALREVLLRNHVSPVLGKTKAVELTAPHVRHLVDRLNRKKLAGASVRAIVSSLSSVLDHGVRSGGLPRNVCHDLVHGDLPSGKRTTEPRYLSVQEIDTLLGRLSDEFRPVAAVCAFAGLRISECLALRWADIDFASGRITVRAGKTAASVADVPLLPRLASELKTHRTRQGAMSIAKIAQDALIFQTATGQPQGRRNALRAVNTASKRAGLWSENDGREPVGLHDCRHSLAANAFALGLNPVEVSKLLRHANPQVTMTVYAGLTGDHVEALSSKLAGIGT